GPHRVLAAALSFHCAGDYRGGHQEDECRVDCEGSNVEAGERRGCCADDDGACGDGPDGPLRKLALGQRVALAYRRSRTAGHIALISRHGAHQLAPENSLWRAMIPRAIMFTTKVIRNKTRPAAISSARRRPKASGKFNAISAAIVWLPVLISEGIKLPVESTRATAMVSPKA